MSEAAAGDRGIIREVQIVNQRGLHARASAKFVQLAGSFNANISVEKDGISVGGTSIMGLMMLAASPGCSIRITANGPEAEDALIALTALVASRFGEEILIATSYLICTDKDFFMSRCPAKGDLLVRRHIAPPSPESGLPAPNQQN